MANYSCVIRTNYFRVKDPEAFRAFMTHVYGSEGDVELWDSTDSDGNLTFGFGIYGGIGGLRNAAEDEEIDADESAFDEFISGLQDHLADDDAIIILEAGHEKLRYVVGGATIITSTNVDYLDITNRAAARAAEMLGNPGWKTKCDY